jgi:hypothetical protein
MPTDEDPIALAEAKRQVYLVSRRLGLLHLAFAETLVEEFGLERGKLLTARAIKAYSKKIGEKKRAVALQSGIELTPQGFDKMSDLPNIGMHSGYEDVEVEGEKRLRAFGCAMGEVWHQEGREDLGRIYCYVDPASTMTFNPDFKMVHTKAMPDGDAYCEFAYRPTTAQDRASFASKDTDWKAIEEGHGH